MDNRRARRLCLVALQEALNAVNPKTAVSSSLKLRGGQLCIGGFSISAPRSVVVLSVGKASLPMLTSALRILRWRVRSGILVAPKSENLRQLDRRITGYRTGHPNPDSEGLRASRHVIAAIEQMKRDELLLCLISGGASAMLPAPAEDVTLNDKKKITRLLVQSRASIHEINTVRRHLSELKGGRLVERCGAGRVASMIISDVPGNVLWDIGSGLTSPDPTTFQDAANILRQYDLWDSAPARVRNHLEQGIYGRIPETPKPRDSIFRKVHNVIIADNRIACEAMRSSLRRNHTPATILTSCLDMEAGSLGRLLGSIARESEILREPLKKPDGLLLGGETTVDVRGTGRGGRNQEVALAAMEGIAGLNGFAVATLGTDGVDGHSPAAGAIVDGHSLARAIRLGLNVRKFAANNDSYNLFRRLGDSIITGPTGTNVGDVTILVRV